VFFNCYSSSSETYHIGAASTEVQDYTHIAPQADLWDGSETWTDALSLYFAGWTIQKGINRVTAIFPFRASLFSMAALS
jgi:hypothetical protein